MIQNKNISPTFIFFFREDQPHSKAKLRPRSLRLHQFCFSSGVALVFFPPSLHAFLLGLAHTQSRAQPSTHNSSTHSPAHAIRQLDSRPRPPGGEGGALLGAFLLEEMNLAPQQSPAIRFQWVHSHMSDSVADSGRGTSRVSPSRVGGPENCDRV